jgi:hypothetical protein
MFLFVYLFICFSISQKQIQDELRKVKETGKDIEFELDEDIPGLGQHYCAICARHFINAENLATHIKSRAHKRRIGDVNQKQYTQDEAEWASGRSKEILPPIGNNPPR